MKARLATGFLFLYKTSSLLYLQGYSVPDLLLIMKIRDLVILALKFLFLYICLQAVIYFLSIITLVFSDFSITILLSELMAGGFIALSLFGVIVAPQIVAVLSLDKGFSEDRIDLSKVNARQLLHVAILITGLYMIADNIADPILGAHNWIRHGTPETSGLPSLFNDYFSLEVVILEPAIRVAIGILLVTGNRLIGGWLAPERDFPAED